MTPMSKILIGGVGTALLAWVAHGPLNYGQNFINMISASSNAALGNSGVKADFAQDVLQRAAVLSGQADTTQEAKDKDVATVTNTPGVDHASWAVGAGAATAAVAAVAEKPATKEAVANCQADVDTVIKGKTIEFATGQATLTNIGQDLVNQLAAKLAPCAGTKVEVAGHTDLTGNAAANQKLSETRANSVMAALVAKGVPAARLTAKGYGATKPLDPGTSPEANAKNRRIEFAVSAAQ